MAKSLKVNSDAVARRANVKKSSWKRNLKNDFYKEHIFPRITDCPCLNRHSPIEKDYFDSASELLSLSLKELLRNRFM
jgi:hypothetical protein